LHGGNLTAQAAEWQMGSARRRNRIAGGVEIADTTVTAMPTDIFQASRWTHGNFLFPTVIEVNEKSVVRRKRSWFSVDEMSISIHKVASVHIHTGIIWSEIRIESSGGSDPVTSHGHSKADARDIKELIEEYQGLPENRTEAKGE